MDRYDLWQDTLLIVNTDHGFLLGEHEWWGKILCRCITKWRISPALSGIRSAVVPENRGSRWHRPSISGDAAGLLRAGSTGDMQGRSLLPTLLDDTPVRDYALFGYHGCHINITDGRYVYMRSPVEQGLMAMSTR
jgi:hypothetical protein